MLIVKYDGTENPVYTGGATVKLNNNILENRTTEIVGAGNPAFIEYEKIVPVEVVKEVVKEVEVPVEVVKEVVKEVEVPVEVVKEIVKEVEILVETTIEEEPVELFAPEDIFFVALDFAYNIVDLKAPKQVPTIKYII